MSADKPTLTPTQQDRIGKARALLAANLEGPAALAAEVQTQADRTPREGDPYPEAFGRPRAHRGPAGHHRQPHRRPVMIPADERAELAARYLTDARQRDVETLPPSRLMAECAELRRLLGQVLAVLAERQAQARQLAAIRGVLAAFDWEHSDRQLALEEIERITSGGAQ